MKKFLVSIIILGLASSLSLKGDDRTEVINWLSPALVTFIKDLLKDLPGKHENVVSVAIIPDNKGGCYIVTGGYDNTAKIWSFDGETAQLKATLAGHTRGVKSVAITSDNNGGYYIVSGSEDNTAKIWSFNGETAQLKATLSGYKGLIGAFVPVDSVAITSDNKGNYYIVTAGGEGNTAKIWSFDGTTAQLKVTLVGHDGVVWEVAITSDNKGNYYIVTGSDDNTAKIWSFDGETAQLKATLVGHTGYVSSVAITPDNKGNYYIVTAGGEGNTAKIWSFDGETAQFKASLANEDEQEGVNSIAITPDNKGGYYIITESDHNTAKIWRFDGTTAQELATLEGHTFPEYFYRVSSVAISPDNKGNYYIVTSANDTTVNIWKFNSEYFDKLTDAQIQYLLYLKNTPFKEINYLNTLNSYELLPYPIKDAIDQVKGDSNLGFSVSELYKATKARRNLFTLGYPFPSNECPYVYHSISGNQEQREQQEEPVTKRLKTE